ncbi:hypothetical protein [Flavobacterium sp. GCM10027622]|uniref:hypothetical protein n=1 Tax=unclassified Flavobacterium TaxID=196869 RepID=UPI003613AE93
MRNIKRKKIKLYILPTLVLLTLVIISALILFPSFQKNKIKNVKFNFVNNSSSFKKISCQIKLNDSVFIKSLDLSKTKDSLIELKNGFYKIEVSTINDDFKVIDSFKIKESEKKYIYISFSYSPSYNEYLPIYKKRYFERCIKKRKYSEIEKAEIRQQIDTKFTIANLKLIGYTPRKESFEIKVLDYQYMKD